MEVTCWLRAIDVEPVRAVCTACADWAGDGLLGSKHIQYEGWESDFEVLKVQLASEDRGQFGGSLPSRYCRRRLRMQRLLKEAACGGARVAGWRVGGPGPSLAPLLRTAALAAELSSQARRQQANEQARPVEEPEEGQPISNGRLHLVGDLIDLLIGGPQPWRCGPLLLFDRFDLITADPYHEVDLVIEATSETEGGSASSTVRRIPAAVAEWSEQHLREVQQLFTGARLVLPPDNDLMALHPLPSSAEKVPESQQEVVLVARGRNTFAEKARNAVAGGAVGAVVINNEDGALFRMGAGHLRSPAARAAGVAEQLPPLLLLPRAAGEELQQCISTGAVTVVALEAFAAPRAFVCIGSFPFQGGQAEVWVVADPRCSLLGSVLLVPPATRGALGDITTATVLAPSLYALLRDLLKLGRTNARRLARRSPQTLRLLLGEAPDSPVGIGPSRPAAMAGQGPAVPLTTFLNASAVSGIWDSAACAYSIKLSTQRVLRGWLQVDPEDALQPESHLSIRALRVLSEMSLEAALEAVGVPLEQDALVLAPSIGSVDVLREPCLLLEAAEDPEAQAGSCTLLREPAELLAKITSYAPAYVQRRWHRPDDGAPGAACCAVILRDGQLVVRWSDASGRAGTFQKPLKGSRTELLVEVPMSKIERRLLCPGDLVLVCQHPERLVAPGGVHAQFKWGQEDSATAGRPDVWEEAEVLCVLRAQRSPGSEASTVSVSTSEHERLRLLPGHWCLLLASTHGSGAFRAPFEPAPRSTARSPVRTSPQGGGETPAIGPSEAAPTDPDDEEPPPLLPRTAAAGSGTSAASSSQGVQLREAANRLILEVSLPGVSQMSDVQVSISQSSVAIEIVAGSGAEAGIGMPPANRVQVQLPHPVRSELCTARFHRRLAKLTVLLPRVPTAVERDLDEPE